MNKKLLIIFLIVIVGFVSYFLVTKKTLVVPSYLSGGVSFADKDSENMEEARINLSVIGAYGGCPIISDVKFESTKKDRSLFVALKGFYSQDGSNREICPDTEFQYTRAIIPFNPKTIDEIFLHLDGEDNHYRVMLFDNEYIFEPVTVSNIFIFHSYSVCDFQRFRAGDYATGKSDFVKDYRESKQWSERFSRDITVEEVNKILDDGEACIVSHYLGTLRNLNIETANKLIAASQGPAVLQNIRSFDPIYHPEIVWSLVNLYDREVVVNIGKFVGVDHTEIANELIDNNSEHLVLSFFSRFKGLDQIEIARRFIEAEKDNALVSEVNAFDEVNHGEIARMLIEAKRVDWLKSRFVNFKFSSQEEREEIWNNIARFERNREKERNAKLVEKKENQKLCEEYGGEWLAEETWWKVVDACEFIYLSLHNLYYSYSYESYFDEDEPNEYFYRRFQSEEDQRRVIEAKELVNFLGEEYKNFRYYDNYENYFDEDEPKESFYNLPEEYQIGIIKTRKLIPLLEENYKKEIDITKKYCMEVGGEFRQYVDDYKTRSDEHRFRDYLPHWVVRCRIK